MHAPHVRTTTISGFCAVVCALLVAACGGGGENGAGSAPPACLGASTPTATSPVLFAGDLVPPGNVDGVGAAARFSSPSGIAADSAGNLYVADTGNHTIRKITPAGAVTTLAGTAGVAGSIDATGAAARFNFPRGIAADSAGNLYVADTNNHTIRKITPAGAVTTLAGTAGVAGSTDATGAAARFNSPRGVAADGSGNLYVADTNNNTIRKITPAGVVTTVAGSGQNGWYFYLPAGVATDSGGNVYAIDSYDSFFKITPAGVVSKFLLTQGTPHPRGVATDGAGNLYVADADHTIRKITSTGVLGSFFGFYTVLAGNTGVGDSADGTGAAARFYSPAGVATDSAGNVYVADTGNHTIRKITPAGVATTLAGSGPGSADGTGAAARFRGPQGVATDSAGNVYVADTYNYTIRKITPAGLVTTLAGTAGVWDGFGTDGTGASATFGTTTGVATDSAGNVYVAAYSTIRKITPAGVVTTIAGSFGCLCPTLSFPDDVATDSAANLYVPDLNNHVIRKITPAGVVTTLAGSPGFPGSTDGTGAAARFKLPRGIATDSAGNVYVADTGNHTIRKITPAGVVTTLAGIAGLRGSSDGAGASACFSGPSRVATDSAGNIYVADTDNHTIRKITPAGVVSTVVGVAGQPGFAPGAVPGLLSFPIGVAISGTSLYVNLNNGIAVVTNVP